jgi:hypothetical protein
MTSIDWGTTRVVGVLMLADNNSIALSRFDTTSTSSCPESEEFGWRMELPATVMRTAAERTSLHAIYAFICSG